MSFETEKNISDYDKMVIFWCSVSVYVSNTRLI